MYFSCVTLKDVFLHYFLRYLKFWHVTPTINQRSTICASILMLLCLTICRCHFPPSYECYCNYLQLQGLWKFRGFVWLRCKSIRWCILTERDATKNRIQVLQNFHIYEKCKFMHFPPSDHRRILLMLPLGWSSVPTVFPLPFPLIKSLVTKSIFV